MKKISVLLFGLLAAATMLTACEKQEATPSAPPPPAAQQPSTAPAEPMPAPADAAPMTPAEAPPAEAATPADTAPVEGAAALPESCEAYLAKVNECIQKNTAHPETANMLKEQEAQLRESWAKEADKEALGAACKQASDIFAQNAAAMGC